MKSNHTRLVVGAAIGAAAIAVAVDHTRQRLPDPEKKLAASSAVIIIDEGDVIPAEDSGDCNQPSLPGRQGSPCSL